VVEIKKTTESEGKRRQRKMSRRRERQRKQRTKGLPEKKGVKWGRNFTFCRRTLKKAEREGGLRKNRQVRKNGILKLGVDRGRGGGSS